jgi:hypothetical protein
MVDNQNEELKPFLISQKQAHKLIISFYDNLLFIMSVIGGQVKQ